MRIRISAGLRFTSLPPADNVLVPRRTKSNQRRWSHWMVLRLSTRWLPWRSRSFRAASAQVQSSGSGAPWWRRSEKLRPERRRAGPCARHQVSEDSVILGDAKLRPNWLGRSCRGKWAANAIEAEVRGSIKKPRIPARRSPRDARLITCQTSRSNSQRVVGGAAFHPVPAPGLLGAASRADLDREKNFHRLGHDPSSTIEGLLRGASPAAGPPLAATRRPRRQALLLTSKPRYRPADNLILKGR